MNFTNIRNGKHGSVRLNIYRHFYRLHPFSLAELSGSLPTVKPGEELLIPYKSRVVPIEKFLAALV